LRGSELAAQGFSAQDVAEQTAYRRVVWAYFGTGLGRDAAESALAIARDRPWFKKLGLSPTLNPPETLDPSLLAFMRQAAHYDPLAIAQAVKVPALVIFGAKDSIAPASLSLENLIQAYARGGNRKASFALFPNAGHGLQVVTAPVECHECSEREMQTTQHWDAAPGFFKLMLDWLDANAR
ncbi:MAG: alpha/beta hydrolase, partial [Candidatus Elarobacter sp.]